MLVGGWPTAYPAELVTTESTRDMVAATLYFLNLCPTERAEANIDLLRLRPQHELLLQVRLTRGKVPVPLLPAVKADPSLTVWALNGRHRE